MKRLLATLPLLLTLAVSSAQAQEIGFIEDFALADDREEALATLIPGSRDYYYYHALHSLNTQQFDRASQLLNDWIKAHGRTNRVIEIQHRLMLLTYDRDSAATLKHLREQLNLNFNHQREAPGADRRLPTRLNPDLISREQFLKDATANRPDIQLVENRALESLVKHPLTPSQRRQLLQRLARPDVDGLVQRIMEDLKHTGSGGFGSLPIHTRLLRSQLDELAEALPNIRNDAKFVMQYLRRLQPADADLWRYDKDAKRAYLDRLWDYVKTLQPVHNSLKVHVLYHRLDLARTSGDYPRGDFFEYLQLPRRTSYVNPKYLEQPQHRTVIANLGQNFQSDTLLPPVLNDEPLVRDFLHHFFVEEANYDAYLPLLRDQYVKAHFAEAKLVNGLGNAQNWFALLPPGHYQTLRDRVDLDFALTNKTDFTVDEDVRLELYVKNVKNLIVKVYEINLQNYYRQEGSEVAVNIELDGLVPNHQLTFAYDEPPVRRMRRAFTFPMISDRGVYVVDFIGNGTNSRALIRKGKLRKVVQTTAAGHVFTVYDEANRKIKNPSLWMAGRAYEADENGKIVVPFSTKPGRQSIVLSADNFHWVDSFNHQAEQYSLQAGFYIDREALLSGRKAVVVIRPGLRVNGAPAPIELLEDIVVNVVSTDIDGVQSKKEVRDFKLNDVEEGQLEIRTPARLSAVNVTLSAKVKSISRNETISLTIGDQFQLNGIDVVDKTDDVHLAKVGSKFLLEVLGKTGEVKAKRPVIVRIKHRDFTFEKQLALQTDDDGWIDLGSLDGIERLIATPEGGQQKTWVLPRDMHSHSHRRIYAAVGDEILVPYSGSRNEAERDEISLLGVRGGAYADDHFDAVRIDGGLLRIKDLPEGRYSLHLKRNDVSVQLIVAAGDQREQSLLGKQLIAELPKQAPLSIRDLSVDEDNVTIRIQNANERTRVHLVATRYLPEYNAFTRLNRVFVPGANAWIEPPRLSHYAAGRQLGDEYRYIIDRQYAQKYPGNMLPPPAILLHPWALRKTDAETETLEESMEFERDADDAPSDMAGAGGESRGRQQILAFANLDFLAETSPLLLNLRPDKNGVVRINRGLLKDRHYLTVVAIDAESVARRTLALPSWTSDFLDIRLRAGLDPNKHFIRQRRISVLRPGNEIIIGDFASSRFEAYSTLQQVYRLYATLKPDANFAKFNFVLQWPTLEDEQKQALYSEHACHELNFYIYHKDRAFFDKAIRPHLANKHHKTFVDHWLLEADLSHYAQPWSYSQMNSVERILLTRRDAELRKRGARRAADLFDLIPPNPDRADQLYKSALSVRVLDEVAAGEDLGMKRDAFGALGGKLVDRLARRARPASGRPGPPPAGTAAADERQLQSELKKAAEKSRNLALDKAGQALELAEKRRERGQRLYVKLDKTQEWAENNYYQLPIEAQNADLVKINKFWRDYAAADPDEPFLATSFTEATGSFTEMMLALSVLDLPLGKAAVETEVNDNAGKLTSETPAIIFHQEYEAAEADQESTPILVNQNFFRKSDPYRVVDGVQVDKFVNDEFLIHTPYGCQIVVTNPTSTPQTLDLLIQIPTGALPVERGQATKSVSMILPPFNSQKLTYFFYFPAPGDFDHFPVHVAKRGQLLAFAKPAVLHVVKEPTNVDKTSWAYISQYGSDDDVLQFLRDNNPHRANLDRIAFRMKEKGFFLEAVELLKELGIYHHTTWSYGVLHNHPSTIREYLRNVNGFVQQCGLALRSPLLDIDPVERKTFQFLEYRPLVNPRTHQLGARSKILNGPFREQYQRQMRVLSYERTIAGSDRLSVVYYLLIQGRITEAIANFAKIDRKEVAAKMQYDFVAMHLDFYEADMDSAEAIANRYLNYPVDRWRKLFVQASNQIREIRGAENQIADDKDRAQVQEQLASAQPSFDFKVEAKEIRIDYENLDEVRINYYEMDVELMFSRNPFVQQFNGGQFSFIRPNSTQTVKLGKDGSHSLSLPAKLHNKNVLVEVIGAGRSKTQPYYSNSLTTKLYEDYGHLRLTATNNKALRRAYVKVYARLKNGEVEFYKDGYTDLRGRFDYTSLNSDLLNQVDRFALLILSEENGAIVREAAPPKQ